jgi:hypothetical protein
MVDDDAVARPRIVVRPAVGRFDDFAEVVGVKKARRQGPRSETAR